MNFVRLTSFALLLVSFAFLVPDAKAWRGIEIARTDSDPVKLNLTDDLTISFTPTHLVATSGKYDLEIPLSEIEGLNLSHELPDLTSEISELQKAADLSFTRDKIILADKREVYIFSLEGILIYANKEVEEIDISGFPAGVYIVKTAGVSFKIIK